MWSLDKMPSGILNRQMENIGWLSKRSTVKRTTEVAFNPSVQFSNSVMSDSLLPHELQHTKPRCPSPTPRVYSNSCPLSQWCHPAISSSVVPFSFHPQPFPASGSFPMSQFFTSGGQSIGVSASASVLPMNIEDWSSLNGLAGSPCSPRNLKNLLQHHKR